MKRCIVITGATGGIGKALAMRFWKSGHEVYGCGRNLESIASITHGTQGGVQMAQVDVSDAESVRQWANEVFASHGVPDLLINNAAVINKNALFVEVSSEDFDEVIDINIKGVANVMRAFLPAMIARNRGVVVNMSSGWGRSASPEVAPYCATKWAIEGLTRAVALELPDGMAAIPLSPNTVNTSMLQSCFGKAGASYSPDPDVWAEVVAPWLLELSPQQNGQPLSAPM